jgi:hypothetical protein
MRTSLLAVAFFLSALSYNLASAADTDEYENIHTVAVISRVGDTFHFQQLGMTIFSNSDTTIQVPDWELTDKIASMATAALSSRFTVIPSGLSDISGTADLRPLIRALPPEKIADAYIVIAESKRQVPMRNFYISGLGIFRQEMLFGRHFDMLHADYLVGVLDGKTFKQIDYGTSQMKDGGFLGPIPAEVPSDESNWADDPNTLTDLQKQAIKSQLTELIEESLPHALASANLIPKTNSNQGRP